MLLHQVNPHNQHLLDHKEYSIVQFDQNYILVHSDSSQDEDSDQQYHIEYKKYSQIIHVQ